MPQNICFSTNNDTNNPPNDLATAEQQQALQELRESQHNDFTEILEEMDRLPVTVRLLDPPLHEFLPEIEDLLEAAAEEALDQEQQDLLEAARRWNERNPMIGTRGVRLAWLKPGLYEMQTLALLDAIADRTANGGTPLVEIMIPLTVSGEELAGIRQRIQATIDNHPSETVIKIGTMIETPRESSQLNSRTRRFFSSAQMTQRNSHLFSLNDVESSIMGLYLEQELLQHNPFQQVDTEAVTELVKLGIERGRRTKPDLSIGVCGEHGGDPVSIGVLAATGIDYVSCSPPRIPIARLAAAQAAITQSIKN